MTKTIWVLALAGLVGAHTAHAAVYHVELLDLDPGQPLTPPVAVVHGDGYSLFEVGSAATDGLEMLAEDGITGALVMEAEAGSSVRQVVVGGVAPTFASFKFLVEGEPGDRLSLVSMFAKTNDNFVGIAGVFLPGSGGPLTIETLAYDAGTEMNTGMVAHIPAYGNEQVGPEEFGTITEIQNYTIVDDPDTGVLEFSWPPAARVVITPMPNALRYQFTITGQSEGQPLTPPLVTVHDNRAQVFALGSPASDGLEQQAETGATALLTSELIPVQGVWSATTFGDGPGFVFDGEFWAEPGQLVSITSMFARTNDVFVGVAGWTLPGAGETVTIDSIAHDAGTEANTGLMADVPAYGGTGEPDEDSVVTEINQYSILDDPSGRLDYTWPPAAQIVIQPMGGQSNVELWEHY